MNFYKFLFNTIKELLDVTNTECHIIVIGVILITTFVFFYVIKTGFEIRNLKKKNRELELNIDRELIKSLNRKENEDNSSN